MDRLDQGPFSRAIKVLTRSDRRKIAGITILQVLMGGLDLLGVIAVGLLGALSVSGLQSNNPGDRVSAALKILHIHEATFQTQVLILGGSAVVLLVGRTILSIFFTRRILFFLSRRGARISADLISRLLSQPLLLVQSRTTQETVYAVTAGVERIVFQVLATAVVWIADLPPLLIMIVGFPIVDPITAFLTIFGFFIISFFSV